MKSETNPGRRGVKIARVIRIVRAPLCPGVDNDDTNW
jgi:hypothetical protein